MPAIKRTPFSDFLRLSSWPSLLTAAFLYSLGGGIVTFRGDLFNWSSFWLGLVIVLMLQLSCAFLTAFYTRLEAFRRPGMSHDNRDSTGSEMPRGTLMLAAVTTMTVGSMVTVLLFASRAITPTVLVILGLALLLAFVYAVPPFRLVNTGYGDLVMAVLLTTLFPALGYGLQTGEMTSLLGMLSFPLAALYLAMVLALSLETYYGDLKSGKVNLMIRLGWQRGMVLHNILILAAYLLIGIGAVVGMAWALTWPRLLTLPIGLFQFWQIWQIGNGAKPRWTLLRITAIATFAITVYLQAFTLWVG